MNRQELEKKVKGMCEALRCGKGYVSPVDLLIKKAFCHRSRHTPAAPRDLLRPISEQPPLSRGEFSWSALRKLTTMGHSDTPLLRGVAPPCECREGTGCVVLKPTLELDEMLNLVGFVPGKNLNFTRLT